MRSDIYWRNISLVGPQVDYCALLGVMFDRDNLATIVEEKDHMSDESTPANHGKKKKKRTRYNVSPEEFVVAWQRSETVQEVCDRLGMPKANVLARASNYRSRGVILKEMPRGRSRHLEVEKLNRLEQKVFDPETAA